MPAKAARRRRAQTRPTTGRASRHGRSTDHAAVHEQNEGGTEQDHPQGRENAPDHWDQHLEGSASASLLRSQEALLPDFVGLYAKHFDEAGSKLLRLDHCLDEAVQLLDSAPLSHVAQRFQALLAKPNFLQHPHELLRERVVVFLPDPFHRGLEGEACFPAYDQYIDHVGQYELDFASAALDLPAKPERG